jgi:hypothetical protein
MKTLLEPIRWPTPEEMQALIRQAHIQRAQAVRQLFAGLFTGKAANQDPPYAKPAALRAAA